ncbi:MAG: HAMP domain-containing protein [Labilithrix sp.]|nr:HAMP domain-containing protein [Labilithrix sp.]
MSSRLEDASVEAAPSGAPGHEERTGHGDDLEVGLRSLRDALRAARRGDFFVRLPTEGGGLVAETALAFNALVEQNESFAEELDRVARTVGVHGELRDRVSLCSAGAGWTAAATSINQLLDGVTSPTLEAAEIMERVTAGDLSREMALRPHGQPLDGAWSHLRDAVNGVVANLRAVSTGVSHVVGEIAIEGRLGVRAESAGLQGSWLELVEDVNLLSSNLAAQVRSIARVLAAMAEGDLSQKISVDAAGEILEVKDTINSSVDQLRSVAAEVIRVAREVGTDGKLGAQADVRGAAGIWQELTDNVNMLAGNLTNQVRNIAAVTTAVASGDLSTKITVEARGEILELKDTINAMVDRLRTFAAEVTRVAREVGTEGRLAGQAEVPGVAGTWKDLTDNVNVMASNLTSQVRGIAKVVTAVANGDLTRKFVVEAKGEIAALADTINAMTDTLRTFAEQVTTVAREVGVEGKLGGQALVPGASGTWRDLVDNVNRLAGNLTTQVRAIAEVAGAVTKGDLTRTIDVEALGELLALKNTINQMIANLRDTTRTNKEQDWLKSNLAKFSGMMQGQRSIESLGRLIMSELTPVLSAQLGTLFVMRSTDGRATLELLATYGYTRRKHVSNRFALGEGLVGQAALEGKPIVVTSVPDDYVAIASSLGEAPPRSVAVLPILFEGQVRGVIELGSFEPFSAIHLTFLEQLTLSIGVIFNMIEASRRTEELLEELKRSNVELEHRSGELEDKARLLEVKNGEIAQASANLEEKARQLSLVSKYKSEFLANMSHELRTPLNSIMVLSNLLGEDGEHLDAQRLEYARTIYSSGRDLLALINQILDLSKIEAGRMEVDWRRISLAEVRAYLEQHFRPLAAEKGLCFEVTLAKDTPRSITTDPQRLQQILTNLLANAFKFTERGTVAVHLSVDRSHARGDPRFAPPHPAVLDLAVSDTGIGIAHEKQQLIFEAFQQADASTSRLYGGTGLGLTISRELAQLLGGEIRLRSTPGVGSTFTLSLPLTERASDAREPSGPGGLAEEPSARADEPRRPPRDGDARPSSDLSERTLLVVDDDIRNLFAVSSLLERHGARVVPARSAREAFRLLEQEPAIDVVLLDMMMPETDGMEAARRLREDPRYHALPIVALTAKALPDDRERALAAGCDDFVPKPIERERLLEALARFGPRARSG